MVIVDNHPETLEYNGHLTIKMNGSKEIAFQKQVDNCNRRLYQTFNEWDKNHKSIDLTSTEIIAQKILMRVMPNYQIILMDNGAKDNQYDFLATNRQNTIAIEVTQAINAHDLQVTKHLEQSDHSLQIDGLKFDWHLNFTSRSMVTQKSKKPTLKKILEAMEDYCINKQIYTISDHVHSTELSNKLNELKNMGIIGFFGKKHDNFQGTAVAFGPWQTSSYDANYIFNVVRKECSKTDNLKKLESAKTNEAHIFIAISFDTEAAYSLSVQPNGVKKYPFHSINKTGDNEPLLPASINCAWVATFFNFTSDGIMGYRLIKITLDESGQDYIIENISNGITPYKLDHFIA